MSRNKQCELLGLDLQELSALIQDVGQPEYRAQQLFEGLYRQRVASVEEISTLPQDFRRNLVGQGLGTVLPAVQKKFVSQDGTVRYLVACADGESIDTVWMPEGAGAETGDGSEAGDQLEIGRASCREGG